MIIRRENYIKPEIRWCICLETRHHVAILKTCWIRIIQRAWKKVFKKRQEIIQKLKCPNNLNYTRMTGKTKYRIPGLKGMLQILNSYYLFIIYDDDFWNVFWNVSFYNFFCFFSFWMIHLLELLLKDYNLQSPTLHQGHALEIYFLFLVKRI